MLPLGKHISESSEKGTGLHQRDALNEAYRCVVPARRRFEGEKM